MDRPELASLLGLIAHDASSSGHSVTLRLVGVDRTGDRYDRFDVEMWLGGRLDGSFTVFGDEAEPADLIEQVFNHVQEALDELDARVWPICKIHGDQLVLSSTNGSVAWRCLRDQRISVALGSIS